MATHEFELQKAPKGDRDVELWLQHAAGRILFEDVREYALQNVDPNLSVDARLSAVKGINDALYGLMMVIDGVSGALRNQTHSVELAVSVKLLDRASQEVLREVNLADGDGMCMGYHGWMEGNFGENEVAVRK